MSLAEGTGEHFDTVFKDFTGKIGTLENLLRRRTTGYNEKEGTFCFGNDDFNLTIKRSGRSILEGG